MPATRCLLIPDPSSDVKALTEALEGAGLRVIAFDWPTSKLGTGRPSVACGDSSPLRWGANDKLRASRGDSHELPTSGPGTGRPSVACGDSSPLRWGANDKLKVARDRLPPGKSGLHDRLLRAYQAARGAEDMAPIVAFGAGWDAALAIACQLPASRIALVDSGRSGEVAGGEYRRVRAFVRHNATFCVADILAVAPPEYIDGPDFARLRRMLCSSRVYGAGIAEELWRNDKEVLNMGVSRFLSDGVLPKSLAENPEMCIIYG